MAVTISLTADASTAEATLRQFQASITQSLAAITAKMQDTAQKTGQTTEAWRTSLTNLSQATIKMVAPQQELSKAMLQTGQAAERQLNQFEKLRQDYLKTIQVTKTAAGGFTSMLASFRGMAAAFGVGLSISGLVDLTKSIIEAGIAHDRLMLSLKGALGTAQAAGEAYAFVEGVANRLGIGLLTAVEGFAKLSAATQGTVVQGQQTRDLFVAISEASRVMGLTSAETGGIVTALTQIIGKNTVSMEELRQQLGERLPSALRLTAKEMGLTTSRFIEMVSKGEILAVDFIPAITRAMQQMGKEAPAAAQSVQAALERVGNAWLALKVTIAQSGVLEALAKVAEEATRIIKLTTDSINRTKRMAGEMGITAMAEEMNRVTQELQAQQEILEKIEKLPRWAEVMGQAAGTLPGPTMAETQANIKALQAQRDVLGAQLEVKRKLVEQEEKVRNAAEATAKQDIANAAAKEAEIAVLKKASAAWTSIGDDIKEVETSLKALRSFDVESLKALNIDISAPDAEQQFNRAEAFLLKRRQELLDKQAGLDKGAAARAVKEAGESAVERAKAEEEALKTSLQRQETMIEASADKQRRAIDEATSAAIVTQGPGVVEAEAAKRAQALQKIATETAAKLETLRLGELEKQTKAREVTLQAEIAAAGKNLSARVAAEKELTNLVDESEKQRAIITGKRADAEQKTSKQIADAQIANAREVNKIIQGIEDDRLKGRIALVDEQIALIEAQVEGEVLTTEQGIAQIQALEQQRFADKRVQLEHQAQAEIDAVNVAVQATIAGTEARVQAEALAAGQIQQIRQGLAIQIEGLNFQQETQAQVHQNELLKDWREWARDVQQTIGSFLVDVFEGQIRSIQSLFDRLKSYFFRVIADMIAYAATHAIVVPIVSAVLGGTGGGVAGQAVAGAGLLSRLFGGTGGTGTGGTGGTSGGLLETGGTALTGVGLAKSVYNMLGLDALSGYVSTGLVTLKESVLGGLDSMFNTSLSLTKQAANESALLLADATGDLGRGTAGAAASTGLSTAASIAGGLTALGFGIYSALNASNIASKAAYAASAAAGAAAAATAAYGAVTGAAVVTAAGTGWTGIGLIVAAVMAVVGIVLDKVIKPEGPSLSVGRPGGLNITRQGNQLGVEGDVGTQVTRREGPSREFAVGVQAQMEAGITAAVTAMVQTINAVALDPGALLEPTQNALQAALRAIQPLNTANADKMTTDITEQLKFINVAIVGGLLEPVNKAFDQLRDRGTLAQQLERLPGTVSGMVTIFKNLNEQLDQINKGENTDVLRQVSAVRNQIENFGNRMAGTAGQIAEQIVTTLMDSFQTQLDTTLAGQITQFAGLMNDSIRALGLLRQTQQTIEGVGLPGGGVGGQIDRLVTAVNATAARVSTEIVTTALQGLSADLKTILVEPLRVQASTVNSLFNDAMATLAALGTQWQNLSSVGLDTMAIQGQFSRLLDGILGTVQQVLSEAFAGGDFGEFMAVLGSIPEAVTNLNPVWAQLRQIGSVFAQVVGPIVQTVGTLQDELRSTSERVAFATDRISELRGSLVDVGSAVDRALPLYAQLAQAMQAQAAAQIQLIHEQAEAMREQRMAGFEAHRGRIEAEVDRVTDFWNTWAEGERTALDARVEAERKALDTRVQAEREALDTWVTAMTGAINAWADTATTTANQLRTVNEAILAEQSPAKQKAALEAQKAGLINLINTTGSQEAMTELIRVEQQLLALAKQSSNLAGMQSVLDELAVIQGSLTTGLAASTGQTDPFMATQVVQQAQADSLATIAAAQKTQTEAITFWQQVEGDRMTASQDAQTARIQQTLDDNLGALQMLAQAQFDYLAGQQAQALRDITAWEVANVRAVKEDLITQLRVLELALQNLFAGQQIVQSLLHAPIPVTVVGQAAQRGGIIGLASGSYYAQGGMVPAMLEPGERIFSGMNRMQMGALTQMNNAFPRFSGGGFMVPGSGSGDTVPMLLPSHSFVLNRRASGAMGMQGGGYVSTTSRTVEKSVVIHVDLRGSQFSKNITLEDFKALMRELERRGYQR